MKRSRIILLLRLAVVLGILATPAIARPETASAGFTWDTAATTSDGTSPDVSSDVDGWTWDESTPSADEAAATDVTAEGDGWTWDEDAATSATEPAPAAEAPPAAEPAPATEPAPAAEPSP